MVPAKYEFLHKEMKKEAKILHKICQLTSAEDRCSDFDKYQKHVHSMLREIVEIKKELFKKNARLKKIS